MNRVKRYSQIQHRQHTKQKIVKNTSEKKNYKKNNNKTKQRKHSDKLNCCLHITYIFFILLSGLAFFNTNTHK